MMAKRKALTCDLCDLSFTYPSKYRRHLDSETHKRFSVSLNCLPDEVEGTEVEEAQDEIQYVDSYRLYQVHFCMLHPCR